MADLSHVPRAPLTPPARGTQLAPARQESRVHRAAPRPAAGTPRAEADFLWPAPRKPPKSKPARAACLFFFHALSSRPHVAVAVHGIVGSMMTTKRISTDSVASFARRRE